MEDMVGDGGSVAGSEGDCRSTVVSSVAMVRWVAIVGMREREKGKEREREKKKNKKIKINKGWSEQDGCCRCHEPTVVALSVVI